MGATLVTGRASAALLQSPDDSLEYEVGTPAFYGQTTVRVAGDGRAVVRFAKDDHEEVYQGTLSGALLTELRGVLAASDPRRLVSRRELGVAGEARVRFRTESGGVETLVELWDNERDDIPAMRALVAAMNKVARQVSRGRVRY